MFSAWLGRRRKDDYYYKIRNVANISVIIPDIKTLGLFTRRRNRNLLQSRGRFLLYYKEYNIFIKIFFNFIQQRLKELVKVTTDVNDLDKDEVNIISGVLEMRKKTVGDIMTHIDDAYMLPITAILDFETISEIMNSGKDSYFE